MPRRASSQPRAVRPAPSETDASERLTPAMRQYQEHKRQVPDALLLFRMGDFYELFYEDAEVAAKALGIALTSRDGGRTPLAGIPHHALESYLAKLVAAGFKVAISEQLEDPRQAQGIVKRGLVRVVTPGTLTDETLLDRARSNILAAVCGEEADGGAVTSGGGGSATAGHEAGAGLAALELSTGQFTVLSCPPARLLDELGRLAPAEVLLPQPARPGPHVLADAVRERTGAAVTCRPADDFAPLRAERLLREHFQTASLEGFGFTRVDHSLQAAAALLAYVRETQKTAVAHVRPPRRETIADYVVLDPTTLRSLEVERTLRTGAREGSLLAAVDRTCNPMGARLLRTWLCYPLKDQHAIRARQSLVEALRENAAARQRLRELLRDMADISRIVGRLGVQRTNPRDLRALGDSLAQLAPLRAVLAGLRCAAADELAERLAGLDEPAARLCSALRTDVPAAVREGGIFAPGYHAELDRLRALNQQGQHWLAEFQARESARTGIPSLKVAYNQVFGFYIEVTHVHRHRVPPDYVRKQTVKNAERYITDELKRHETEALSAEARAQALEYELFVQLRDGLMAHIPAMQRAAAAVAELDVLAGWAVLSLEGPHAPPEFVPEPVLEIDAGRHPVVGPALGAGFVPNDTRLAAGGQSLALITGPNMAGKSTYIRQVALLTLLAHCGAWVPAQKMRLGAVDRIFTRVGASDELARGQSTFMVEMLETANILHNATPHSLVILDEIGRGTSTFDGISLAWAITEHLATRVGCRTLFATHYHELTELGELLEPVFNLNVAVREYEDQVVFLHRIVAGAADRSYGLHVGKLAGLPPSVLERASAVLAELERTFTRESQRAVLAAVQRRRQRQLRLFEEPEEQIVRQVRELGGRSLTPQDALTLVRQWRALLGAPPEAGETHA